MPTKKPRVTFAISEEQLATVEAYQRENKLKNQSRAILDLIEKGLSDFLPQDKEESPPHDEGEDMILNLYRGMNQEGQEKLLDYATDLADTGKYKKAGSFRMDAKEA